MKKAVAFALTVGFAMTPFTETFANTGQSKKVETLNSPASLIKEEYKVKVIHKKGTKSQLENLNKETIKFIKEIASYTYEIDNKYGLYPSVTIAQAILESSNGKSALSKPPNHNLFGIKGFYEGASVKMQTKEDDGTGELYTVLADFKKYPDFKSSIEDHGRLLKKGVKGFYKGAWRENAETYEDATEFLEGRYATDTSYASKLNKIIKDYNLTRFDGPLDKYDYDWLKSDSLDPWEKIYEEILVVPVLDTEPIVLETLAIK